MRRTNDRWSRYFSSVFIGTLILSITALFSVACVSTYFKDPRTPAGQEAIPGPNTAPVNDDFQGNAEKSSPRDHKTKNKYSAPDLSRRSSNGGKTLPAEPKKEKFRKQRQSADTAKKNKGKYKNNEGKLNGRAARLKDSRNAKDSAKKERAARFQISKNKKSNRESVDYQKSKGAKKMLKKRGGVETAYNGSTQSRNIAQENVCNSIQFKAFPDLNFAIASGERLRSAAFSNDDAYIAVTQNTRIGTHFFYYQGLGTDVIDDIFGYFDDYGAKPSLVRLHPENPNRHVAIYGNNGFSTTYPTNSEVFDTLDTVNNLGHFINDVALSTAKDSIVVLYRFNETIAAGDYSGFTGYNIPTELYDELEFLYDKKEMVYQVAMGPIFPGFFEPSWIISYGDGFISYYGIPNDVRNELISVSNLGNRIENIAFDSRGGVLIHSIADDGYNFQSLVQFQTAIPYTTQGPKISIRNMSNNQVELSFQSRLNEKYQIMSTQNVEDKNSWVTSGDEIIGNGLFKTVTRNKTNAKEFFVLNSEFTPTCTRLAYRFYTEPDPETAVAELSCLWNGSNYQPFNEREDVLIGKFKYGFSSLATCDSVISKASASGVCNWNGAGYSPYNILTGTNIGKEDFGFQSLNDCTTATSNGRNGAICNWNGSSYSPYSSQNVSIGKTDFGYNTLNGCVDAVAMSNSQLLCNWNSAGYQPYYVDGKGQVGKEDYGFGAYATCNTAISKSSTQFACNWNGIKTQPYAFDNNVAVLADDLGFSITDDCFNTTAKSEPRKRVCHPYQGDYARFKSSAPKVAEAGSSYFFYQQCVDSQ